MGYVNIEYVNTKMINQSFYIYYNMANVVDMELAWTHEKNEKSEIGIEPKFRNFPPKVKKGIIRYNNLFKKRNRK